MCGICGRINFNNQPIEKETIRRMCEVIRHRGPDSEGVYPDKLQIPNCKFQIGLGIRRLAIIDLQTGDQPIHNEDKSIWLVFNGEIYNFQSLRTELEKQGHKFYTQTDTEVIVHLYEQYGTECLKYLRGMFAIALWDERHQQLFLARDRVGKKPLCYAHTSNYLIFASELKSIIENPEVKREIDHAAIDYYLTYQYIPAPLTIFKGIRKLPPASYLICDARGKIEIKRYWEIDYRTKLNLSEEEYCQRIMGLLEESTRLRLISDVPLGALLSGGIDSSAVVGLMARHSNRPVKTFSIGFEEEDYSELPYAKIVAQHFQTEHHEFIVKPDTIEILPKLVWHYNEPYADSSMLPTYYVARETRRYVTVALNGDGGDESFAGYQRYLAQKLARFATPLGGMADFIPKHLTARSGSFLRRLKRFLAAATRPPAQQYLHWMFGFEPALKNQLYAGAFQQEIVHINALSYLVNIYQSARTHESLDRVLATDVNSYLPEDLLVKMDIATMANSLEGRSPFLDHTVMEFAAQIPANLKLKGLTTKYILKKALKGFLPAPILRRGKMGFGLPISQWFRTKLSNYLPEILLSERSLRRGYFKPEAIRHMVGEHLAGQADHGYHLWTLLVLELWHRIFMDGERF